MPGLGCPAPGGRQAVLSIYAFRAEGSAVSRDEPIFASLQRYRRNVAENDLEFFSFTGTTHIPFFNLYRGTLATCYSSVDANLYAPEE